MTLASKDHNCDNEDDDINDIDDTDDDRYGFNACLTCCLLAKVLTTSTQVWFLRPGGKTSGSQLLSRPTKGDFKSFI